jgi:hypothetical protein
VVAYPDLDSISINDTIWFQINSSTNLKDIQTGRQIDYSNVENMGSAITFLEFIGGSVIDPGVVGSTSAFNYNLILGSVVTNPLVEQIKEYKFLEEQGNYKFKLGVVPKKKGIFGIGIGNAANVYRKSDKCTKAGFNITFKNTNQHLYFLEQNRPGYTPSGMELTNLYCFKVK